MRDFVCGFHVVEIGGFPDSGFQSIQNRRTIKTSGASKLKTFGLVSKSLELKLSGYGVQVS